MSGTIVAGAVRTRKASLSEIVFPCGNVWKNFEAVEDNQLSVTKGDVIVVTQRSGTYWWWGTNEGTQVSGYFPKDHLWFHTPWRRAHDQVHERDYFVNVMTGNSVWEVPEGFVEDDEITPEDLVVEEENNHAAVMITSTGGGPSPRRVGSHQRQMSSIIENDEVDGDEGSPSQTDNNGNDSAGIAALHSEVHSLRQENAKLRTENVELKTKNKALEQAMTDIQRHNNTYDTARNAPKRKTVTLQKNGGGMFGMSGMTLGGATAGGGSSSGSKKRRPTQVVSLARGSSFLRKLGNTNFGAPQTSFAAEGRRNMKRLSMKSDNSYNLLTKAEGGGAGSTGRSRCVVLVIVNSLFHEFFFFLFLFLFHVADPVFFFLPISSFWKQINKQRKIKKKQTKIN